MRKTRRDMTRKSAVVCWAVVLLLCSASSMANGLQAWLDTQQIGEGQSVKLYLMVPADAAGEPELSALRRNFDILNIDQGSRMQVLNGHPRPMRTWQLTLTPKRPGKLSVPALRIGQATSPPLQLEVLPSVQVPANRVLRDVMLQTDVNQQRPYVQAKVIYTVRLYTRLDLHQVHFTEPEALGSIIERLGEDKKYNTYFGRYRYHVLQRRFVIFPQRSGRLAIISPLLQAQIREKKRERPLQMRGPEIALEVQPQPDATLKPWLPAESLSLSESWSPDLPSFRVGEPVTRSITITAQGVTAAQLPDLAQSSPQEIQLYPQRPVSTTQASDNTLVTRKVLNYAMVAKRAGNYSLPEIRLSWWDTATGERKTEVLAARDIVVLPGKGVDEGGAGSIANDSFPADSELDAWWQSAGNAWKKGTANWPWLILLLAMAWLTKRIVRWRGRRLRSSAVPPKPAAPAPAVSDALLRFELACKQKNPHLTRKALIDWAAATWPNDPPQRLDRLAKRLPPQAADQLAGIDRALYAPTGEAWDGMGTLSALLPLLQDAAKDQGAKHDTQVLPPLYPE